MRYWQAIFMLIFAMAISLTIILMSQDVRADTVKEWLLIENFNVVTFPTAVRNIRSFPIAGPYPYLKHTRKMSCHRAYLILSQRLSISEMQQLECVPIIMKRK